MQARQTYLGTRVTDKQQRQNKLTPTFSQYRYLVANFKGNMITAFDKDTEHTVTRNISFFKVISVTAKVPKAKIEIEREEGDHHLPQVPQLILNPQPRKARDHDLPQVSQPTINRQLREDREVKAQELNEKFILNVYDGI